MILKRLYSEPKRIDVVFQNGLNIICSDKTEKSSARDTRNGTGKTTFIKLIDFCLLGEPDSKILNSEEFQKFTFSLELQDEKKGYIKIKRSMKEPNKIQIAERTDDYKEISLEEAHKYFKEIFFGIPLEEDLPLTFRTLMNFIRRDENTGFSNTFRQYLHWQTYLVDAVNLYLIGLDYHLPINKESFNKEKSEIEKIIFGLSKNLERKEVPKKSALKSEKLIIEDELKKREKSLKDFKVHSEYETLENEANTITKLIKEVQRQIFVNGQRIQEYQEVLSEYHKIDFNQVKELYNSINIYLKEDLQKKYEEIADFHKTLINNRNTYLSSEIKQLLGYQDKLNNQLIELDKKRSEILRILETHGALSEFNELHERLDEAKEKIILLGQWVKVYDEISEYKKEKADVSEKLRINNEKSEEMINKKEEIINQIVLLFEEIYKGLVSVTGILAIGVKDKYKIDDHIFEFSIKGERGGSPGITRSKIFAYDLSILFHNFSLNRIFPHFLIHDGIFNGVESRTRKNALDFITQKAKEENFQYILTSNTDDLPEEYLKEEYCIVKLTDQEDGNLMGFKF